MRGRTSSRGGQALSTGAAEAAATTAESLANCARLQLPEIRVGVHLRHVRQELEANLFAGDLLMPETSVRAMHKVTGGFVLKMARHFRVSPRAMEIRLERLQLPYTPVLR